MVLLRFREIQWSTSVVVDDLNDLNVFLIICLIIIVFVIGVEP